MPLPPSFFDNAVRDGLPDKPSGFVTVLQS
jgi:hypothetical protein